jgi:hypothetical protein
MTLQMQVRTTMYIGNLGSCNLRLRSQLPMNQNGMTSKIISQSDVTSIEMTFVTSQVRVFWYWWYDVEHTVIHLLAMTLCTTRTLYAIVPIVGTTLQKYGYKQPQEILRDVDGYPVLVLTPNSDSGSLL